MVGVFLRYLHNFQKNHILKCILKLDNGKGVLVVWSCYRRLLFQKHCNGCLFLKTDINTAHKDRSPIITHLFFRASNNLDLKRIMRCKRNVGIMLSLSLEVCIFYTTATNKNTDFFFKRRENGGMQYPFQQLLLKKGGIVDIDTMNLLS